MPTLRGFRSIMGRRFGLDSDNRLIINERPLLPSPLNPGGIIRLYDDFLGDLIADEWGVAKGSDAAAVDFAVSAAVGGMVRATTGAGAGASMAANGVQLHAALNWSAAAGNLVFDCRLKMAAITTVAVFVGFTDQIGSLEMPINSAASANTITTNASDAVGLMFDTSMTDDYWWGVGVKADTDATHVSTGIAPTADTWQRLRVEVDTSGNAGMFIDGKKYASVSSAVTASTPLTPVIAAFRRAASSTTVDVDYISVTSDRA